MRKERSGESGKARAIIETLSREYLARGLMKHPDAGKHVASINDIENAPLLALLKLVQKMGVDHEALIAATEREENARLRYSDEYPAFVGCIEFDLVVEVFGKRVTRKARAHYTYTPQWRYWDLRKNAEYEGWHGSSIRMQFLIDLEADNEGHGEAEWRDVDPLAIDEVWNHIEDAIEEKCRVEDAERRRLAAEGAESPARHSRARH